MMEKLMDSFINRNSETFCQYFEDYRFSKLQNIKEYQEIKEEKSKIYDKYPSVRELFEDELAKGYTIEEQNAIEEIFRLDGMLDSLELKEAFKLGLREFFVFAIEQDLIKINEIENNENKKD